MKLCSLKFMNINSLAGAWEIDFEDNAFSEGLFAIEGKTGSGKSSILDAICLSLYGRTPRMKSDMGEVITKGTTDAHAETVFEVGGQRYRASWTLEKNNDSSSASPTVKLERLEPNPIEDGSYIVAEVLANKSKQGRKSKDKSDVMSEAVKKVCGMDFERFTRIMMLPQGAFDRFLRADEKDRAKLLEEITGSDIYRKISAKVFDRAKDEKTRLDTIETDMRNNAPMSDEEIQDIHERLANSEAREKELATQLTEITNALGWYKERDGIREEDERLSKMEGTLGKDMRDFEPEAERLALSDKAATCSDLYSDLVSLRDKVKKYKAQEPEAVRKLAQAENNLKSTEAAAEEASRKLNDAVAEKEALEKLVSEVNNLDIQIKGQKKNIHSQAHDVTDLKDKLTEASKRKEQASKETEELGRKKEELNTRLSEARDKLKEAERRVYLGNLACELSEGAPCPLCGAVHHPSPYGAVHSEGIREFQEAVEHAQGKVQRIERELQKCDKDLTEASSRKDREKAFMDSYQKDLEAEEKTLEAFIDELSTLETKRRSLFGSKDTDAELSRAQNEYKALDAAFKKADTANRGAELALTECRSSLSHLRQDIEERSKELETKETTFLSRIKATGFSDEKAWLSALLDSKEASYLRNQKDLLEKRKQDLVNKRGALEERETRHKEQQKPSLPYEGLSVKKDEVYAEHKDILKEIGANNQELETDAQKRKKYAEKEKAYKEQEKIYGVWDRLNERIGSAQGDRFAKIVQSINLRRLVTAANVHLERLSDRYMLAPAEDGKGHDVKMDFNVTDLLRGGEIRTTANLSGGESFIISLALALGLSQGMKELQLDSLFMDEGFGTLDDENLNTVLNCLGALRQGGKTIGIISHVEQLKNSIRTRISITKGASGHSTISGPGCRKLADAAEHDDQDKKGKKSKKKEKK